MRFYTIGEIGPRRKLLANGSLLCLDVPIARTGTQLYAEHELPGTDIEWRDGVADIERHPEDVFRPETVLSFNGVALVNDHPSSLYEGRVTPDNWPQLSVGMVVNPRRGEGALSDVLVADVLVTERAAIDAVLAGKREISSGYDADYQPVGAGRGRQVNIIGNHVALVERGRCGPRCAIGDSDMATTVTTRDKAARWLDRFRRAIRTKDEELGKELLSEVGKDPEMLGKIVSDDLELPDTSREITAGGGDTHIHVHTGGSGSPGAGASTLDDPDDPAGGTIPGGAAPGAEAMPPWAQEICRRIDAIETVLTALAEEEGEENDGEGEDNDGEDAAEPDTGDDDVTGDRRGTRDRRPTGDSAPRAPVGSAAPLAPAFAQLTAAAKILAPAMRVMTFDAKASARVTFDQMCDFRRRLINHAWDTEVGHEAIVAVQGHERKPVLTGDRALTCDSVAMLVNGAATYARSKTGGAADVSGMGQRQQGNGGPPTPAEINARNREWARANGGLVGSA